MGTQHDSSGWPIVVGARVRAIGASGHPYHGKAVGFVKGLDTTYVAITDDKGKRRWALPLDVTVVKPTERSKARHRIIAGLSQAPPKRRI